MRPFSSFGWVYLLVFLYLCGPVLSVGFAEELYCGLENCYDVGTFCNFPVPQNMNATLIYDQLAPIFSTIILALNLFNRFRGVDVSLMHYISVLEINRDEFDKAKLSKIYRSLAKKFHPDRVKDQAAKVEAEARFRVIATAYETLKDDQTRSDYDYYLDHPEERFYNYYQYYRRRVVPKVDVRLVILGTILSISLFQYFSAKQKYSEAIAYAVTVGKFRNMAINAGVERGVLEIDSKGKLKKIKGQNNEDIIRSIIEENMDVRGGYKKESVYDTLAWHCVAFPYVAVLYIRWYAKWILKYWIKREEYDEEAKLHLIRKNLGMSQNQFNCMTDDEHEDMLARELWIQENFKKWKAERDAEEQEKLVQSGRYKRYKRFMKNNAGTISFLDED